MKFDFRLFVNELRNHSQKKEIIEKYEKYYGKIDGDITHQVWFTDYVSKFFPYYEAINNPEELENDFDYRLLTALVMASFSSDYQIIKPNKLKKDENQKVDLIITVTAKGETGQIETVTKKLYELWSFQIFRLFEIYIKEQMSIQNTCIAEGDINIVEDIYEERIKRIQLVKNYDLYQLISNKKNGSQNDNKLLYHYTNYDSFEAIVKSNKLRACDVTKLNDRREYIIWFEVYNQVYDNIINNEDAQDYLEIIEFINNTIIKQKELDCYVTCFTPENDLLSQWRAYGDDGLGVSIGFEFSKLDGVLYENNPRENEGMVLVRGELEYNYEPVYIDINTRFKIIINDFANSALSFEEYINRVDKLEFLKKECENIFFRMSDLKDNAFFEENEYRYYWFQKESNKHKKDTSSFTRKTKYGTNLTVNYVDLLCGNEKLPIKEIVIGPNIIDKCEQRESIVTLLKNNGYNVNEIIITDSKIPYRK